MSDMQKDDDSIVLDKPDVLPPIKECCKCAAYREIIAEQAAKLAEAVSLVKSCSESLDYVQSRLKKINGVKP